MNLYFSTNGVRALEFEKTFSYIEPFGHQAGIELFPMFHVPEYEALLRKCLPRLKSFPMSCHAPYYESEYSAEPGTAMYTRSIQLLKKTLEYAKELNYQYMVFHHNNRAFRPQEKETMLHYATENFRTVKELCENAGVPLVIENAGVTSIHTMLLNEQEFIDACLALPGNVLIDIGHAHANGWNLEHVIESLSHKIVSYHLHNNDGFADGHRRIFDGTLDFEKFLDCRKKWTPDTDLVIEYCPEAADDIEGVQEDIRYLLNHCESVSDSKGL